MHTEPILMSSDVLDQWYLDTRTLSEHAYCLEEIICYIMQFMDGLSVEPITSEYNSFLNSRPGQNCISVLKAGIHPTDVPIVIIALFHLFYYIRNTLFAYYASKGRSIVRHDTFDINEDRRELILMRRDHGADTGGCGASGVAYPRTIH